MTLYDKLVAVRDEEYRAFQVKLVPNIPAFIRNVDLENGTVTVHRMEGLL